MATDDFFRARLDTMIDLRHPLAVLATGVRHQIAQVFDLIGFQFYFWHYTAVSRRCREGASSPRVSKISRWMGSSSPTPTARSWLGRVT